MGTTPGRGGNDAVVIPTSTAMRSALFQVTVSCGLIVGLLALESKAS